MTQIENIENVARRLRGLRDALDVSEQEIAENCGIDTDTYRRY